MSTDLRYLTHWGTTRGYRRQYEVAPWQCQHCFMGSNANENLYGRQCEDCNRMPLVASSVVLKNLHII